MITERQKELLCLLVREYIDTASPVGSHTMVQKYRLPVSSATVRNDMVELEEQGYILRPHTSSGAVPSDLGYRFYVETAAESTDLSQDQQRLIRHQFHQVEMELDQWTRLAAAIMAQTVHTVALVTLPRARESRWRRLEVVSFQDAVAMVIYVMREGQVRQQIIHLGEPMGQESLNVLSAELNDHFEGLSRHQIDGQHAPLNALASGVVEVVLDMMKSADATALERPYVYGLSQMLGQPEFTLTDQVRDIVATLEDGLFLQTLLQETGQPREVRVLIGAENPFGVMQECALILAEYGANTSAFGALGILGPRRMDYGRAIPVIRYISGLMTEMSTDLTSRN